LPLTKKHLFEQQLSEYSTYDVFKLYSKLNIRILELDVKYNYCSIVDDVVLISMNTPVLAKRIMLGHELAHILLHEAKGNYNKQQEKEANLFAVLITIRYLICNK